MAGHEAKRKPICPYGNAINPPESFYNLFFRFFHYPKSDFITFVLYSVLKISFYNLAYLLAYSKVKSYFAQISWNLL